MKTLMQLYPKQRFVDHKYKKNKQSLFGANKKTKNIGSCMKAKGINVKQQFN